jgi:lipopolysaccharide export system permease protein
MNILFQYIFKKIFSIAALLSLILIGIVWLTQALRFIEIIVNHNISIKGYLSLIICLIPDLLATILPICFLIAGLYTYHKLKNDHELHVLYSLGLSPFQVAKPFLIWGLLITGLIYIINIYISPLSFQHFRKQEHQIRSQFSLAWLREGTFNIVKGVTTYVREHPSPSQLKGVFIYNPQNKINSLQSDKGIPYTIVAESGAIEKTKEGLFFILRKGVRQELDPRTKKMSEFSFDILKYQLPEDQQNIEERATKPYEKSLSDLLTPPKNIDPRLKGKMRIEAHQRLLLPFLAIINTLLGSVFILLGSFNRQQSRYRIFFVSVLALIFHTSLIMLLNLSLYYQYAIPLAYIEVGLTLIVLALILNPNFRWYKLKNLFALQKNLNV